MAKFVNNIQQRALTLAEAGKQALSEEEINSLNNMQEDLFESLGIEMDRNWDNPIPKSGDTPRMFVMRWNADGSERPMDFAAAGIKPGSADFWREVQLGNVFAYPPDDLRPVQLQINHEKRTPVLEFSAPTTAENFPELPVKKPTPWMRFAGLFGGYKRERALWDNRNSRKQQRTDALNSYRQARSSHVGGERKAIQDRLNERLKQQLREAHQEAQQKAAQNEKSMKLMTSIFQPQPELDRSPGILRSKENKYALYSMEEFNSLKQYPKTGPEGIDLSKIQMGQSGQSVKPEEFAAVTMFALWQPESLKAGLGEMAGDPYIVKSLMGQTKDGKPLFAEKDVLTLATGFTRGWWSTDLFIDPPRAGEGSYFKNVTNVGRKLTVEAFQDYAKGDNTKLAKLIADGVNMAADDLRNVEGSLYEQQRAVMHTSGKLLDLMAKDPALAAKAASLGMKPEKVQIVKGLRTLEGLEKESDKAVVEIRKAAVEGRQLTKEERLRFVKAMLKPRIACLKLGKENLEVINGDLIQEKTMSLYTNCIPLSKENEVKFMEDPNSRPEPKEGKIWMDTAQSVMNSMAKVYGQDPKILRDLGDSNSRYQKELDLVAEEIYKVGKLEAIPLDRLVKDLDVRNAKMDMNLSDLVVKAADSLKAREQNQLQANQPTAQKQVQNPQQNGPQKNGPQQNGPKKASTGPVLGGGK